MSSHSPRGLWVGTVQKCTVWKWHLWLWAGYLSGTQGTQGHEARAERRGQRGGWKRGQGCELGTGSGTTERDRRSYKFGS